MIPAHPYRTCPLQCSEHWVGERYPSSHPHQGWMQGMQDDPVPKVSRDMQRAPRVQHILVLTSAATQRKDQIKGLTTATMNVLHAHEQISAAKIIWTAKKIPKCYQRKVGTAPRSLQVYFMVENTWESTCLGDILTSWKERNWMVNFKSPPSMKWDGLCSGTKGSLRKKRWEKMVIFTFYGHSASYRHSFNF